MADWRLTINQAVAEALKDGIDRFEIERHFKVAVDFQIAEATKRAAADVYGAKEERTNV